MQPEPAATPAEYIAGLPEDRKQVMTALRNAIVTNLPKGFKEVMNYGMIGYVVPHSFYPKGYHADPEQPLPFMSIASQKNFVAVYHMGLYAHHDSLNWFKTEYNRQSKTKLDMGKSCIRFKKMDQKQIALIGALAAKMTPQEWIAIYESQLQK